MKQLTFDEIRRTELTEQDHRVLSMLRESNTQTQTAQKLKLPKSTVNQIVRKLEKAKLIRKKWDTRFNILYDVLEPVEQKPLEQITSIRVHNVRRKRKILTPHYQLSLDKRTGYEKDWKMRGRVKWYKYSYLGGVGEPSVSVHITPKTIIGYLNAKQYVIAESVEAAEDKAKQYVDKAIERFVQLQSDFGNQIRIEGISTQIVPLHYGGAGRTDHPAVQEVVSGKVKDWFADQSLDELQVAGLTEVETLVRKNALQFEKAMRFPDALPDLLKSVIDPLQQGINSVEAHIQGMTTPQMKINEQTQMILHLMKENGELRKRVEQLEGDVR